MKYDDNNIFMKKYYNMNPYDKKYSHPEDVRYLPEEVVTFLHPAV
jgi:hypothetical protein